MEYFEFNKKEELTMIEVDVRGFSCPIPVVRTKKAKGVSA